MTLQEKLRRITELRHALEDLEQQYEEGLITDQECLDKSIDEIAQALQGVAS